MMYNKNYYPTPRAVIETMLSDYTPEQLRKMTILEPSAGMGAILDYLRSIGCQKQKVFACEIDPELKAALVGKGYRVIQDDFLAYSGALHFDLILMNPPFDAGAKHLMKAWRVMRNGDVVCLLNAETINNAHTLDRQELADVIAAHGRVEMLGPVFTDAARKTSVEVALVRLRKAETISGVDFNLNTTKPAEDIDLTSDAAAVERRDWINTLCRSYHGAIASTEELFRAMQQFRMHVGVFASDNETAKMMNAFWDAAKSGYPAAHNDFALEFQRHAWDKVFRDTKASGLMTTKVRDKFEKWREEMGGSDLNKANILLFFEGLFQMREQIKSECILEVFDQLTKNAVASRTAGSGEKWKTNSAYMVPERLILGYMVERGWSGQLSVHWGRSRDLLNDIDRALCLISGKSFGAITTIVDAVNECYKSRKNPGIPESEFFTFTAHLKGSLHLKFKDPALCRELNRIACAARGWQLPEEEVFRGKARRQRA